jgi:tetratricopeptide (TPR) repeat protein
LGVRYNRLAGDQARARQAWEEALDYYRAAIDVAGQHPMSSEEQALSNERCGDVLALTGKHQEAAAAYENALEITQTARVAGKLGMIFPLLDGVEEATQRLTQAWDELDLDEPLRPWLAAALGWLALRARPKDMAAVVGAGAAAVAWWQRGRRIAQSDTAQMALKEMMAGRVPPDYSRLIELALTNSEEIEAS